MKNLLIVMIAALSLSACKSNKTTTNKDLLMLQDSSGVSNGSYLTDTGNAVNATPVLAPVVTAPAVRNNNTSTRRSTSNNNRGNTSTSNNTGNSNSGGGTGTTTTAPAPARSGISKAAKGAIIGGVGGAAAGAVIGRNAKGAIIGGAVGAAGGYIIGRGKDRRDGRVQ